MESGPDDSSGTDDDLPPTHRNQGSMVLFRENGQALNVGGVPDSRRHSHVGIQIHEIEQDAYGSVLRAFQAQSDAITWEQESLITELRKELRVSNEEHRELLSKVNADQMVKSIRDWRKAGGVQTGLPSAVQPGRDYVSKPIISFSAPYKKQRISQPVPLLPLGTPSSILQSRVTPCPRAPSSLPFRERAPPVLRGEKAKPDQDLYHASSRKLIQHSSVSGTERVKPTNLRSSCALVACQPPKAVNADPLIGRKIMTRWAENNKFYEAVIAEFNPDEGRHALVYNINTENETWEWVNLEEISPNDIRWNGENPFISPPTGLGGCSNGIKKTLAQLKSLRSYAPGRESSREHPQKYLQSFEDGVKNRAFSNIEILHTGSLINKVRQVLGSGHPDPLEIERAKGILKDHEQSLMSALARLTDVSNGEVRPIVT